MPSQAPRWPKPLIVEPSFSLTSTLHCRRSPSQYGETSPQVTSRRVSSVADRATDESKTVLADQDFWRDYWVDRSPSRIGRRFYYRKLLDQALRGKGYRTFIELGGFPGTFAVYVTRRHALRATLLDSYIDRDVLERFFAANELDPTAIDVIEGDLF